MQGISSCNGKKSSGRTKHRGGLTRAVSLPLILSPALLMCQSAEAALPHGYERDEGSP